MAIEIEMEMETEMEMKMEPRPSQTRTRSRCGCLRLGLALLSLILTQSFDYVLCGEKLGKWLYRFSYLQLGSHQCVLEARMPKWNQQQREQSSCSLLQCVLCFTVALMSLICYLFELLFDIFLCRWFAWVLCGEFIKACPDFLFTFTRLSRWKMWKLYTLKYPSLRPRPLFWSFSWSIVYHTDSTLIWTICQHRDFIF